MITYMDRAANGSAKKAIMADLGVSEDDFFWVLIAFQLAYAMFEIPSGWLGDTRGPRSTLLRVVLWWSLFVALTGFVGTSYLGGVYLGFGALIVIQFFFGVGEAGAHDLAHRLGGLRLREVASLVDDRRQRLLDHRLLRPTPRPAAAW